MSDGGVGFYWTKSAFIPDFVGVRVWTIGYYLSLMDSAQEADKGNIRSFTAQIKCFFGKCSPCLSLVPLLALASLSSLATATLFFWMA